MACIAIPRNLIPLILVAFLSSCTDQPAPSNPATPPTDSPPPSPVEALKRRALDPADTLARIEAGLDVLRREYARSIGVLPDLKGVEVRVSEDCLLTIREEKTDGVWERRIDLKSLDTSNSGFRLLPDQQPGEFPGVAIRTLGREPLVETLRDGKPQAAQSEL
ncbi:MAG: hypothetical protein D6816_14430, partial [Bacteroidetes bacterium]